jgi:hypothetical protein
MSMQAIIIIIIIMCDHNSGLLIFRDLFLGCLHLAHVWCRKCKFDHSCAVARQPSLPTMSIDLGERELLSVPTNAFRTALWQHRHLVAKQEEFVEKWHTK